MTALDPHGPASFRVRLGRRLPKLVAPILIFAVLTVAVAGAAVAVYGLGSEDGFRYTQSGSLSLASGVLTPASVDAALAKVPAPEPVALRTPAVRTDCVPRGGGPLRNPWTCVIRYRSGVLAHYLVAIASDGSYSGIGTGQISGCCVKLPQQ
jgi:hypothetical protein